MVDDLAQLASGAKKMKEEMQALEQAILKAQSFANREKMEEAVAWRDDVLPAMNALRATTDHLETMVADGNWPIPNYTDLLFGI